MNYYLILVDFDKQFLVGDRSSSLVSFVSSDRPTWPPRLLLFHLFRNVRKPTKGIGCGLQKLDFYIIGNTSDLTTWLTFRTSYYYRCIKNLIMELKQQVILSIRPLKRRYCRDRTTQCFTVSLNSINYIYTKLTPNTGNSKSPWERCWKESKWVNWHILINASVQEQLSLIYHSFTTGRPVKWGRESSDVRG
jgi:hypothetical protein